MEVITEIEYTVISKMEGEKMEGKKLPKNWAKMSTVEKTVWLMDNYGTDEDDDEGWLIYDTESMPEDVLKAYEEVIVSRKESRKNGIIFD